MNSLTVREAIPTDLTEISEVERLAIQDLRKVYRPTLATLQHRGGDVQLRRVVAEIDGRIVGIVDYQLEGDRLSFLRLAVHPAFRRRGVATALIHELEIIGRDRACRTLTLWTVRETGNVEIFHRLGFAVESEKPSTLFESDEFPSLTEVCLRKDLV